MESGHVNRFLKGIPIPGLEILGGNFQAHQTRHPPRDIDDGNRARRRNGVHQVINLGHKNGDWTQPGKLRRFGEQAEQFERCGRKGSPFVAPALHLQERRVKFQQRIADFAQKP